MSTNKRIAKRLLSAILTMLMLMSMVTIGMASASAATLELAETGVNLTGGEVLYLKPSSDWQGAGARFAVYFFNRTSGANTWESMTKVNDSTATVYQVITPTGTWEELIFCRMNGASTTNGWETNVKWNQTGDLKWDGTNNCFSNPNGTWDGATTTWSTYTPPVVVPEYTVTFNDGHFKVTGDAKVTEGDDYSFTVEPTSGYEVTKVTCNDAEITATDGTYTVTDVKANLDIVITVSEIVVVKTYSVMFVDHDGTVVSSETVEEGAESKIPADPTRAGYFFTGWSPAPEVTRDDETGKWITVTGNAVFTAQYKADSNDTPIITPPTEEEEEETSKWTVMFVDYDNTLLKIAKVEDGKAAEAPEAPERAGYTFTGWSQKFDNVTADLLVVAKYEKDTVPVVTPTHGKLQFTVSGGTGFTIAVGDGIARPQGTVYSNSNVAIGSTVTVVANASSDAEFIGWLDATSNRIQSTDLSYQFTTTGNDFYKAVFATDVENSSLVVFKNEKSNQIVDMQYYSAADSIYMPAIPDNTAYEATEWNMTEDSIKEAIATGNTIVVTPKWSVKRIYVDVEVIGGTISANQNESGQTLANYEATLTANEATDGKKFAYWAEVKTDADGTKEYIIKSYDSTYKFVPSRAITLEAVFVDQNETIEYKVLVSVDGADSYKAAAGVYYYYSWYVPEEQNNLQYTNSGILFIDEDNYNEDTFVLNGSDKIVNAPVGTAYKTPANSFAQGKGMSVGQTYYAKAYVQYIDANGNSVTEYSESFAATKY